MKILLCHLIACFFAVNANEVGHNSIPQIIPKDSSYSANHRDLKDDKRDAEDHVLREGIIDISQLVAPSFRKPAPTTLQVQFFPDEEPTMFLKESNYFRTYRLMG